MRGLDVSVRWLVGRMKSTRILSAKSFGAFVLTRLGSRFTVTILRWDKDSRRAALKRRFSQVTVSPGGKRTSTANERQVHLSLTLWLIDECFFVFYDSLRKRYCWCLVHEQLLRENEETIYFCLRAGWNKINDLVSYLYDWKFIIRPFFNYDLKVNGRSSDSYYF